MQDTIQQLLQGAKGILAADESTNTISTRLKEAGIAPSIEADRKYRQMLFTAPDFEKYISGVILYKETVDQKLDNGTPIIDYLKSKGVILGIKVDEGLEKYNDTDQEITKEASDLESNLKKYYDLGFRFAKWRAIFSITDLYPADNFIADTLSRMVSYASFCQSIGIVPIVEPEVSMKGNHTTTRCEEITTKVLRVLFDMLKAKNVDLGSLILKSNMILPGKDNGVIAAPLEVANATLRTLRNSVPKDVPAIVFLSGGQNSWDAVEHLDKIEDLATNDPWKISFSYSRALQEEPMRVWGGKEENVNAAQTVFLGKLSEVSLARQGKI